MKGGRSAGRRCAGSSGRDGGRRSEEVPGGDRCAEINPGRTGSRTARSETGTRQDPQENLESEDPGKTFREDHGSLGEDQVKTITQEPEASGIVWTRI